jgi:tRNA A-37 threonylcarbamoyl transferase component Bud32
MTNVATTKELSELGHQVRAPFSVRIDAQNDLTFGALLRILPGKRIVGIGEYKGKQTLIKLFFHSRNYLQELSGVEKIKKTDINTPPIIEHFALEEGGICFYELLENTQPFDDAWKSADQAKQQKMLEELLSILKKMYDARLYQSDLHLGNFIYSKEQLYALDPASLVPLTGPELIAKNLAALIAQFPLTDWQTVLSAVTPLFPELNNEQLNKQANTKWQQRMRDFLKKIYRDCTYVKCWSKKLGAVQQLDLYAIREHCSNNLIKALETIITLPPNLEYLKKGESSLVYTVEVDGHKRVIKNSRNKSIWRTLRRFFGRSRASNSWYFSHLLAEAGINTPKPIALVERKWGPLVLESWFVSDYIEADTLLDVWLYEVPSPVQINQVKKLFDVMRFLGISHGDMKATNLLVANNQVYLIDFDSMQQHRTKLRAYYFLKSDRDRLLMNWPNRHLQPHFE